MSTAHWRTPLRVFALLLVAGLSLSCGPDSVSVSVSEIAPAELASRIAIGDAPLVLDVRTPEEFAAGHVPGALNIPHDQLAGRLGELGVPPSSEIVVHCQSGRRAQAAGAVLREAGYGNVRDLSGHMAAWRAEGLPLAN